MSRAKKSMPRVAQVLDSLQAAGKERIAVNLANGLAEHGYASYLISTRVLGPLAEELRPDVTLACAERRSRWDRAGFRRLCDLIDKNEIGIVHSHNPSSSYLMRWVRAASAKRFLHVVHDHHSPGIDCHKSEILDRLMLRRVSAYLTASQQLAARARRVIGLPQEQIRYIPNGVRIPPVRFQSNGPPVVVHVANLHPPKDHATSVRAAALVQETIPDLQWRLIGKPRGAGDPYYISLCSLIESSGLCGAVQIFDNCTNVVPQIQNARAAVLTSRYEGLPLSLLECLACGVPVVMSDVGQGPAILRDTGAGVVVPAGQPNRTAEAVRSLLINPERAQEMGQKGRAYVERFHTVEQMVQEVHDVYKAIQRIASR